MSPHLGSPAELQARLQAERTGRPFLVYRDAAGGQQIFTLGSAEVVLIGRGADCELWLDWDTEVSRLHAELRRAGRAWLVVDDGLSRNGTYVNGARIVGRHRLDDTEELTIGNTTLVFRDPRDPEEDESTAMRTSPQPELSPAQRRVLVALCRPYRRGADSVRPATNQEIAAELFLTVAAVKKHLHSLFQRFDLEVLPQNEKRARLVQVALDAGVISLGDIEEPP